MAMYDDITEREEIKRANERLEAFTGIVSHELRNPLSVAQGRLELARETDTDEHFTAVERAHDRMDALIGNLLALAREGETVTDAARPISRRRSERFGRTSKRQERTSGSKPTGQSTPIDVA